MEKDKKEKSLKIPSFLSVRFVFGIVIGILMIVGVIITLVSSAQLTNVVLAEYVLGVDECDNYTFNKSDDTNRFGGYYEDEASCRKQEEDAKKRDIANNIAFLLFSIPLSYLTYHNLRKLVSI